MFGRRRSLPPEHSSVSEIESILTLAATESPGAVHVHNGRPVVERAVWLCGCIAMKEAPAWLIYDTAVGSFGWCRMPDGSEVDDLVDAQMITGDHVDPEDVLHWLRGEDSKRGHRDSWPDEDVMQDIGRRIQLLRGAED